MWLIFYTAGDKILKIFWNRLSRELVHEEDKLAGEWAELYN
jgi:hypothetical protein